MTKFFVAAVAALGIVSATLWASAQGEMLQVGVGTPVAWTFEGTPGNSATGVAIIDRSAPFRFEPKEITVAVGSTVIWTNLGAIEHTVRADNGSFDSTIADPLATGETFAHVFTTVGDFPYKCQIHPSMRGTVHVT
jgi:plastocyanin